MNCSNIHQHYIIRIIFNHYCNMQGKEVRQLSLSTRSIFSYRLMLARILRLDIEEEHYRTVSITPLSPSNSSIMLLLSKQNRALECLFRIISKELFGNETHHKNLREIIIEYILTNSESLNNFCPATTQKPYLNTAKQSVN